MIMKRLVVLGIAAVLFVSSASGQNSKQPATPDSSKAEALPLSERLPAKIQKIQQELLLLYPLSP